MQDSDTTLHFIDPEAAPAEDPTATGSDLSSGFPSPAEHFTDAPLDLNRRFIRNPAATFFARVEGDALRDEGIHDGDLLLIDKSVGVFDGCLAVCFLDGEFRLKRIEIRNGQLHLHPSDAEKGSSATRHAGSVEVWGVVIASMRKYL